MITRTNLFAVVTVAALLVLPGCAVSRGQESVGSYVDDSVITSSIKSRFVKDKEVDATAISVETLNGTVMLSGFAKTPTEKATAEMIARETKGVKQVRSEIVVRP